MTGTTRRTALAAAVATLAAPSVTAPVAASGTAALTVASTGHLTLAGPDEQVIRLAAEFIAAEQENERLTAAFHDKVTPWTAEDDAAYRALDAASTGFHERLAEISEAEVTTPLGLLAQATVMLWQTRNPTGDECHLWNLADSVFAVLRAPLPAWALDND